MGMSRRLPMLVVAALVGGGVATLATGTAQAAALVGGPGPDGGHRRMGDAQPRPGRDHLRRREQPARPQRLRGRRDAALYQDRNVFFSTLDGQQTAGNTGWTTVPWSPRTGRHQLPDGRSLPGLRRRPGQGVRSSTREPTASGRRRTARRRRSARGRSTATRKTSRMDMDATTNGHVLVIDGVNTDIYDYGPGPNGTFDAPAPGRRRHPAGVRRRPVRGAGPRGHRVLPGPQHHPRARQRQPGRLRARPAGAAGQRRQHRGRRTAGTPRASPSRRRATARPGLNLYIFDRGVDNDTNPSENDGRFYEMAVTLPPLGDSTNRSPQVSAGPDLAVNQSTSASLAGSVSDDGLPDPPGTLSVAWSTVSGPGTVVFANPSAASTRATFGAVGSYVLRLTADDGDMAARDDVSVVVSEAPPGGAVALDVPDGHGHRRRGGAVGEHVGDRHRPRAGRRRHHGADRRHPVPRRRDPGRGDDHQGLRAVHGGRGDDRGDEPDRRGAGRGQPAGLHRRRRRTSRPGRAPTARVGWTPAAWPTAGARGIDQQHPRPHTGAAGDRGPDRLGQRQRARPRDHRHRDAHRLGDRAWPGRRRPSCTSSTCRPAGSNVAPTVERRSGRGGDPPGGGVAGRDGDRRRAAEPARRGRARPGRG